MKAVTLQGDRLFLRFWAYSVDIVSWLFNDGAGEATIETTLLECVWLDGALKLRDSHR